MEAVASQQDASDEELEIVIRPQEGPQTDYLQTTADIAIYGGAAGGGKSYALLLEPLRHHDNPRFGGVIFRRNSTQIRNQGGLWHESVALYGPLGGRPKEYALEWTLFNGLRIKFGILEYDKSVYDWHGSQIPFIGFDELTTFTERQFFYMLSRNRSTSGVPGYVRATCNPDADSWVRKLIDWWIGPDGNPIQERSGVIRWFIRVNENLVWGDTREELIEKYGKDELPKSLTFIPSTIFDNKILLQKDPGYLANLNALSLVERARLLKGNWNIRATAGTMFRREWFPIIDVVPGGWTSVMRFWDRAATKPHEGNKDPDWTRGLKVYKYPDGTYLVADLKSMRDNPGEVEKFIRAVASHDGPNVMICSQQDPGSAGKMEAQHFTRMLAGYIVSTMITSKDKVTRAKPVSAQAHAGNIYVLRSEVWNDQFFTELENFPDGTHDDIVDTLSGAFNELCSDLSILDVVG